jgi:hypothetical protein
LPNPLKRSAECQDESDESPSKEKFKRTRIDEGYGEASTLPLPLKRKAESQDESDESPFKEKFKRAKTVEELWRNVNCILSFLANIELSRRLFLKNSAWKSQVGRGLPHARSRS